MGNTLTIPNLYKEMPNVPNCGPDHNERSNGPAWARDGLDIRASITTLASPSKGTDLHPDLQQWRPVLNVEDAEIFSVNLLLDVLNVNGYIGVK